MAKKNNKKIKKAVENYEVLTGDEEVKRLAEIKLLSDLEEQSALASARANGKERGLKQGKEIGLQQGKEIGLQQGKEIGLQQGEQIGSYSKAKEIAKKLLKRKLPLKDISEISGLSIDEIKKL